MNSDRVNMDSVVSIFASYETHDMVRFLQAEGQSAAEVQCWLCHLYGDNANDELLQEIQEWAHRCERGQEQYLIVVDEFVWKVNQVVCEKCHFTISDFVLNFLKFWGPFCFWLATQPFKTN